MRIRGEGLLKEKGGKFKMMNRIDMLGKEKERTKE